MAAWKRGWSRNELEIEVTIMMARKRGWNRKELEIEITEQVVIVCDFGFFAGALREDDRREALGDD